MPIRVANSPDARAAAAVRALVRRSLAAHGRRAGEISVTVADDALLRDLNRRYRGLDRTTDVLSFAYDGGAPAPVDGDLVLSRDRVRVQARRYRVTPGRELARLIVHGALHLAGFDHDTVPRRRVMRGVERAVLRAGNPEVRALEVATRTWTRVDRCRPRGRHSPA